MIDSPIFIAGAPRSGTSLTAGLIKLSGAWFGATGEGRPGNPKGFFENVKLKSELKKVLGNLHVDKRGLQPLPSATRRDLALPPSFRSSVYQTLGRCGYHRGSPKPWAFKDPKLTLTWPEWNYIFPGARWILVRRDPETIIRSCRRSSGIFGKIQGWEKVIEGYIKHLEQIKLKPGLWWREVWPATLVANPVARSSFRSLIEELGLQWHPKEIDKFIEPSYWHE